MSTYICTYIILTYFNVPRYITSKIALSWTEVSIIHLYIYIFVCVLYCVFTWYTEYVLFLMCFYMKCGIHIVLLWLLQCILNMYRLYAYFVVFTYLNLVRNDPTKMFKHLYMHAYIPKGFAWKKFHLATLQYANDILMSNQLLMVPQRIWLIFIYFNTSQLSLMYYASLAHWRSAI